jgi:undecaprenyl-diphosphatase
MNATARDEAKIGRLGRAAWIGLGLAAVAAAVSFVCIDQPLSRWILKYPSEWQHIPWISGLRQFGKADVPIWLLLLWGCLTNRWRPTVATLLAMVLVGMSVTPLKMITARERPHAHVVVSGSVGPQEEDVSTVKRVSFPSGDTAVAFALATTLSFSCRGLWGSALFLGAGVIGVSRVTVSAHYPSDVLAGAILGVFCGVAAIRATSYWRELEGFRAGLPWRLPALGVVIFIAFIARRFGRYIGMKSLPLFLEVYWPVVAVVTLVCLAVSRWRARGDPRRRTALEHPKPEPDPTREPTS